MRLAASPNWKFCKLEAIDSAAELTQRDYAESWAWVHLLLTTTAARGRRCSRIATSTT
jgi:hypothetical protein